VVVRQVAGLAHADGVVETVPVLTLPSQLVATEFSVARRAHVLCVVLSARVRTLRDLHLVGALHLACVFFLAGISHGLGFVLFGKLLEDEVLQQL